MPIGGIPTNYAAKAMESQKGVAETTAKMDKEPEEAKKTTGGAMQAGLGGAMAGSVVPGWGTAIGAVVGVCLYYMS